MLSKPTTLLLLILDGWGYREEKDANAIALAHKPHWNELWANFPHTLISGSGKCVGLPDGQMGNSEVGHLNMGAGRIVHQDLTRIEQDIETGNFFENPLFVNAVKTANQNQKAIHLFGLLSPGGVHSHENQIHAFLKLASMHEAKKVYVHAFLDGRDTPPQSALPSLELLSERCKEYQCGKIASIVGRYYAMDRDKRWDRVRLTYDLLTLGKADFHASNAILALEQAYARGETDEFVKPTTIHSLDEPPDTVNDGDIVVFMNFRADRARELSYAFIDPDFTGFSREKWPNLADFICLTEYDEKLSAPIAYPPIALTNILGSYLSEQGLKQLRIAETEKYAHVTFFFNGGIETPFEGEERILIPSPKVATYDLKPEMSAPEVTSRLVSAINEKTYDVIICNFANPDMLGHTGNLAATIKAIETIDDSIGKIITALKNVGGEALITADHGNAEMMYDHKTHQPHTAHTHELVPFVYVGRNASITKTDGKLSDIAPTMLYLLGLKKPCEMTGHSLLELN